MPTIAASLREMRFKHGYSQEFVASYLQISQPAYSKIENGTTSLTLNIIEKLSSLYNINKVDFLNVILSDHTVAGTNFTHKDLVIKALIAEIRILRSALNATSSNN